MTRAIFLVALFVTPISAVIGSPATSGRPSLLAFGDSLSAGYGLPADQAFPRRLQDSLAAKGIDIHVINGSVSGDTTAGGLARVDWALADHPQFALVELGANDALRGLDPQQAYQNLDKILRAFEAAHVKILLLGMRAPRNWGPQYDQAFQSIYPRLAKEHRLPLYPFFLDGVALDPNLTQPDGLHPNAAGVDAIVARVLPYVQTLVQSGT